MSGNYFVRLLSLLVAMTALGEYAIATTYSNTPCISLAEIAAESLRSNGLTPLAARSGSYRVSEVMWDPVLGQRWAMVASCEHPERPAFAVPTKEAIGEKQSGGRKDDVPVVRAGDVVRLWWQEDNLRIEMTAMSEENGGLGKVIRVRMLGGDSAERQFVGVVRGVADVEMRR
jgi:hypothetical protein